MTISLASEIFTDQEMLDGTAEAWLQTVDPDNVASIMQSQHGNATVMITVIHGEGLGVGEAYNSTTNTVNALEQAPLDQQLLDTRALNGVTTNQTSTNIPVLDKKGITVFVNVDSGATGGTIKIQAVNDDGDEEPIGFLEANSTSDTRILSKVCTTGNYVFTLPPNIHPKTINIDLSSVTDGTFTVDVTGGAL